MAEKHEAFEAELQSITDGGAKLKQLEAAHAETKTVYEKAADALSAARRKASKALDKAVLAELPALKLDKARFETQMVSDAAKPGADGIDRVEFVVAANPGTPLQPLMKVASGGELARFMLALKVVLAAKGSAPVLIFDEIDTGVGGAVADAIGQRLSRLAERPAGAGGDAFAAGCRQCRATSAHIQDGRRGRQADGDPRAAAVRRKAAVKNWRACCRARRSPMPHGRRPMNCWQGRA